MPGRSNDSLGMSEEVLYEQTVSPKVLDRNMAHKAEKDTKEREF
jgi:hypothetical protein